MKIFSICKYKTPIMIALMSCVPLKTLKIHLIPVERDAFNKQKTTLLVKDITSGLKKEFVTNFWGGVIERFDSVSMQILKNRIAHDTTKVLKYCFPIKEIENVYTEPFGHFLAKRPHGREHLGLDIFVTPFSRKPKKPVTIVAPIDGIVVSNKFARKADNVIGNSTSILGADGKTYTFDHMARGTDYPDSIPRHKVGEIIKMGTPLGYVGSTGETTLWHLHFGVLTDKQLAKQLKDPVWLKRSKISPYSALRGQVNPQDPKEAGEIANVLNKFLK